MNSWRGGAYLLMALLGVVLAGGAAAAQSGKISGRVVTEQGEPVAGAQIEVRGSAEAQGTIADAAGRFALTLPAAGTYRVRVQALGYRTVEREVSIASAGSQLEFTLQTAPVALSGVVVSATRSSTAVAAIPGAVSVITRDQIADQAKTSEGMGEILGKAVPGLAIGTQSASNHGQTLRGRNVVVLIDGVPQSTLRNVSRDFATMDPAMIERVEVLRGATSLYGDGATGGVINIITRRPGAGEARYTTELGMDASLSQIGEVVGGRLTQSVMGKRGALDYVVSGSLQQTGGYYDAEGDLIPADPHGQGGLADTRGRDLLAKLGYEVGAQRLQLSANLFRSEQDTRFTADPAVDEFPIGAQKARALEGLRESEPQGTHNTVVSLDYTHDELLGSRVHVQAYYRDYLTRFRGFDRRRFKNGQQVSGHVGQSFVDSEKLGGRLELESSIWGEAGPSLVWGADYTYENTSQLMTIMDPERYDQSGGLVFEKIGERVWVPPLKPHNLGLFAQVGWELTDRLLVRGGVRRERIRMHVDDFGTIDDNQVYGGNLSYDPTLFNVGAVLDVTEAVNVYGNFSQGFSLADIGRILRGAKDGFDLGTNSLQAPTVDHYEVGMRGTWNRVQGSLTGFYSTSDLGTRLVFNDNNVLEVVRSPERIYGGEATLDVEATDRLGVGGTLSWTEGEAYEAKVQEYRAFDGYRIQPLKATAHLEHRATATWRNRLQVLYSGSRDRAFRERIDPSKPAGYGQQPIESFWVVDLTSRAQVGPGSLSVGVQNLLNQQYYDIVSQLYLSRGGNQYYTAARGAMLSVSYSIAY